MRASASINNSWTQEKCQKQLKKIDKRIEKILLRGLAGVQAEMSLLSSCFNMARMISIIGVSGLLARLTS